MKFYIVAQLNFKDPAWIAEYAGPAHELVHKHGGKYLVRASGLEATNPEGGAPGLTVVVEFPSKEAAEAWYNDPEYQQYKKLRLENSEGMTSFCPGLSETANT